MCEVLLTDFTPHPTNTGPPVRPRRDSTPIRSRWFGIEQEYTFLEGGPRGVARPGVSRPRRGPITAAWAGTRCPARPSSSATPWPAWTPGSPIEGTNAEVMMGQWEFQIGVLAAPPHRRPAWVARWLLFRIADVHCEDILNASVG